MLPDINPFFLVLVFFCFGQVLPDNERQSRYHHQGVHHAHPLHLGVPGRHEMTRRSIRVIYCSVADVLRYVYRVFAHGLHGAPTNKGDAAGLDGGILVG